MTNLSSNAPSQAVHPTYNRTYWFNGSGETSWEMPVDPVAQAEFQADLQVWEALETNR